MNAANGTNMHDCHTVDWKNFFALDRAAVIKNLSYNLALGIHMRHVTTKYLDFATCKKCGDFLDSTMGHVLPFVYQIGESKQF